MRTQIVALVLAVALPALGFGAYAVLQLGLAYRDEATRNLRDSATILSQAVERDVRSAVMAMEALAASPLIERGDDEGFARQAASVAAAFHGSILLATADGLTLLDTARPGGEFAAEPLSPQDLGDGAVLAGRAQVNGPGSSIAATLMVGVRRGGRVTHRLRLLVGGERFRALLAEQTLPEGTQAALVDASGLVIARSGSEMPAPGSRVAMVAMPEGEGAVLRAGTLANGSEALFADAALATAGWSVQVALRRDRFDAIWQDPLRRLALAGLALLLAATSAALILGRWLATPLRKLADQAEALTAGHAVPALPPSRTTEVEQMRLALLEVGRAQGRRSEAERRAAEAESTARALAAAEMQFHALVDRMPQIVWTASPDGRNASLNRRWYDFTGLAPERGDDQWHAALHPEDAERTAKAWAMSIDTGETFQIEYRFRGKDGAWRWFLGRAEPFRDAEGRILRWFGTSTDISEIVAARDAAALTEASLEEQVAARTAELAASEARLRGIFDAQFQFIALLAPDGTLHSANRTALDYIGVSESSLQGMAFWEAPWWPADTNARGRLRAAIAEAASGRFVRYEAEIQDAEGQRRMLDFSIKPVRDPRTGGVAALIPEGRDITDNRSLQRRLAEAEKMEALGQLAGGIAHDFNNILQAVLGGARLIGKRNSDPATVARLAGMVADAAERGSAVTRRLLAFARRDALRAHAIEAKPLIEGLADVLAHTLGPNIALRTDAPPGLALFADQGQLETVLVNLAVNARDAMPNGGALSFTVAEELVEPASPAAGLRPGRYLRIDVTDTGHGMDGATLAHAPEPFFTTKPVGSGTGLGLSMARGFAEQSGGGLNIVSALGRGTTVTLWLPRASMAPDLAEAPQELTRRQTPLPMPSVLLVDDEAAVRDILAAELQDRGCRVATAASGEAALALLAAADPPGLLITDLAMPGMDGLALLAAARSARPGLPGILLTGHATERTVAGLAKVGGHGPTMLLRKPIGVDTLLAEAVRLHAESA